MHPDSLTKEMLVPNGLAAEIAEKIEVVKNTIDEPPVIEDTSSVPAFGDLQSRRKQIAINALTRPYAMGHNYTHTNPERNLKRQTIKAMGGARQYKKKMRQALQKEKQDNHEGS